MEESSWKVETNQTNDESPINESQSKDVEEESKKSTKLEPMKNHHGEFKPSRQMTNHQLMKVIVQRFRRRRVQNSMNSV